MDENLKRTKAGRTSDLSLESNFPNQCRAPTEPNSTMRTIFLTLTACTILAAMVPVKAAEEDNFIPKEFAAALDQADEAYLVSIDRPKHVSGFELPKLDEYVTLGKTKLRGEDQTRLAKELRQAVRDWEGAAAGCFKPRHLLRLIHKDATYEFVVCFECSNGQLYKDGKLITWIYFGNAKEHAQAFNQILKDAKIEVAP